MADKENKLALMPIRKIMKSVFPDIRISDSAVLEMRNHLEETAKDVTKKAESYMRAGKRVTIKDDDIILAVNN